MIRLSCQKCDRHKHNIFSARHSAHLGRGTLAHAVLNEEGAQVPQQQQRLQAHLPVLLSGWCGKLHDPFNQGGELLRNL